MATMVSSHERTLERTLRITTLVSFFFAIALLTPATTESGHSYNYSMGYYRYRNRDSVIGFCFIPLGFTVLTSVAYLVRERQLKKKAASALSFSPPAAHPHLWVLADLMIFSGYLVALVIVWTTETRVYRMEPGVAFLEAYATVPIMLNMVIHASTFLINLRPAFRTLMALKKARKECPHCHHRIGATPTEEAARKETGEGYSLLRGEEYDDDAARASSSEDRVAALPAVEEV